MAVALVACGSSFTMSTRSSLGWHGLDPQLVGRHRGDRFRLLVDPRTDTELLLDLLLDLVREVRVVLQERACVLLALPQLIALVGVPGTCFSDKAVFDAHVDQPPLPGDAVPIDDVEL